MTGVQLWLEEAREKLLASSIVLQQGGIKTEEMIELRKIEKQIEKIQWQLIRD